MGHVQVYKAPATSSVIFLSDLPGFAAGGYLEDYFSKVWIGLADQFLVAFVADFAFCSCWQTGFFHVSVP